MISMQISARRSSVACSFASRSTLIGLGALLALLLTPFSSRAEGETKIERDDLVAEARLVSDNAAEVIVVTHAEGPNKAEVTGVSLNGPNGKRIGPDMVAVRKETVKADVAEGDKRGARVGAIAGAVLGGVLGSAADSEGTGAGTAAGTAGGAAAGAIAGSAKSKSAEELKIHIARFALINVSKGWSIAINYIGRNGKPSTVSLPAPVAAAGAGTRPLDALVVNVQGDVSYQPPGETTWTKLKQGDKLQDGTRVKTGLKSNAVIQLGTTQIYVKPLTQVTLTKFLEVPGQDCKTNVDVKNGGLSVRIQKDRSRTDMRVSNPNCVPSVTG
jgi:hypothetical protein